MSNCHLVIGSPCYGQKVWSTWEHHGSHCPLTIVWTISDLASNRGNWYGLDKKQSLWNNKCFNLSFSNVNKNPLSDQKKGKESKDHEKSESKCFLTSSLDLRLLKFKRNWLLQPKVFTFDLIKKTMKNSIGVNIFRNFIFYQLNWRKKIDTWRFIGPFRLQSFTQRHLEIEPFRKWFHLSWSNILYICLRFALQDELISISLTYFQEESFPVHKFWVRHHPLNDFQRLDSKNLQKMISF